MTPSLLQEKSKISKIIVGKNISLKNLEIAYLGIFTLKIKCFLFSYLGWGLGVIYSPDIFEKLRTRPGVLKIHKSKLGLLRRLPLQNCINF